MAREGVRHLLRRHDAGEDLGPLGSVLLGHDASGATDPLSLIHRFHEQPSPDGWARLATLVLDCGDPAAETIAAEAAGELARLADAVARRLLPLAEWEEGLPVVLAGGLMTHHRRLADRTRAAIECAIPEAVVSVAADPPVAGAVRMALRAVR